MRKLLIFLILFPFFIQPVYADELMEKAERLSGLDKIEELLPEDAAEVSGKLSDDGSYDAVAALVKLWKKITESAAAELRTNINSVISLLAMALLSSAAACFIEDKNILKYINIAGVCTASGILLGGMDSLVSQTTKALTELADYSRAALPAVFTAALSCGAVASASARYAGVSIAIDILMSIARKLIIPLVYAYLALALSGSIFENSLLKSCQRAVKWVTNTVMTAFTLAFSAYMGISGIVSGSVDALAVKTARTLISTSLPVVGGIISDAASTVLSAAAMIKNSAGALSLVAVCAICAGPFVILSVKMLLFKATAAACDMLPNLRMSAFIADVGTALSMLLGLVGCCAIMLFISFMAAIKVVSV